MTRIDCRQISGDDLAGSEQVRLAFDSLTRHGFAILDHVLPQERVRALNAEFTASYDRYLQNSELDDTLKVGNKRYMIPVALSGGFGDPLIYANPFVVALARHALEPDAILESFGAVVSLAGARQQHIHRDGRLLFDSAISTMLPAHALTFVLPLVDMNDVNGTTAIWPGSHRWKVRNEEAPPVALDVPAGSCVLWGFRLYHGGTSNRSDTPRPILYGTYSRHWYRDSRNFEKKEQRHLAFDDGFLDSVPADRRSLFAHLVAADAMAR